MSSSAPCIIETSPWILESSNYACEGVLIESCEGKIGRDVGIGLRLPGVRDEHGDGGEDAAGERLDGGSLVAAGAVGPEQFEVSVEDLGRDVEQIAARRARAARVAACGARGAEEARRRRAVEDPEIVEADSNPRRGPQRAGRDGRSAGSGAGRSRPRGGARRGTAL